MIVGRNPFKMNKQKTALVYSAVDLPNILSEDAKLFLRGLLKADPNKRLGNGINGSEDIKQHVYFKDVNWDDVLNRKIEPEFKPVINENSPNGVDLDNFDKIFTNENLVEKDTKVEDRYHTHYQGFTYVEESILN